MPDCNQIIAHLLLLPTLADSLRELLQFRRDANKFRVFVAIAALGIAVAGGFAPNVAEVLGGAAHTPSLWRSISVAMIPAILIIRLYTDYVPEKPNSFCLYAWHVVAFLTAYWSAEILATPATGKPYLITWEHMIVSYAFLSVAWGAIFVTGGIVRRYLKEPLGAITLYCCLLVSFGVVRLLPKMGDYDKFPQFFFT